MEKDKIFFAESGLTSTSANFIANLAKESYQALEQKLNGVVFYSTTISLLGSEKERLLRQGVKDISHLESSLKEIAQLKSLIAWLREALKAKARLIKEAQGMSYEDFGMEIPDYPKQEDPMTMDEYVATLGIKERNRYYYLETLCAVIGDYIHPNGTFAEERDALNKALQEPYSLNGAGRDAVIYSKTPTISQDKVEQVYMNLQQTYRNYQAELNALKHKADLAIAEDAAKKNAELTRQLKEYKNTMSVIEAKFQELKQQAVLSASNLKIVIPDSLLPIYDKVRQLGKD